MSALATRPSPRPAVRGLGLAIVRLGFAAGGALALTGCAADEAPRPAAAGAGSAEDRSVSSPAQAVAPEIVGSQPVRPDGAGEWPPVEDSIPGTPWTHADWEAFRSAIRRAEELGLDTLPLGDAIGEMGRLFVGTAYVPRTLEVPGPERLVVNFRGLDCVTFVENVLALTRFQRVHGAALLDRPEVARARYEDDLAAMRYRTGRIDGYASRIHYFSEWLGRGEEEGRVRLVAAELGGVRDPEPVGFMTAHRDAYDQLQDDEAFRRIEAMERTLSSQAPRIFLPESAIAGAAEGIRTGDVIAATSTLEGLDVAHTGIAYWDDGVLRLLHAPLVGSSVVLSERSLADRISEIGSQDGIMVGRPVAAWFGGGR